MSELKILAAEAALQKMAQGSHFSICTINMIVQMFGLKPDREAMAILSTLHCVDYNQMRPELLQALPELIATVLKSPSFDAFRLNIIANGKALQIVKN